MPQRFLVSLKTLAQRKRNLAERGRVVADLERELVRTLSLVLPTIGYCLVSLKPTVEATNNTGQIKRLRCSKCDRRFAYPLHLARHMSATHRKTGAPNGRKRAAKKSV